MGSFQVVVPCYNYARFLQECVESVLAQPVDVRVLIIDDCSSDETAQVCSLLAAADDRVSFIRHSENKGHVATYNEGIALARADYFVLLSADDLLTPGSLARAGALLDNNPSVGLVYGYATPIYSTVLPPIRIDDAGWTLWRGSDWAERMCRSGRNFIISPEAVMRLAVLQRLGGYNPALPHSGDMEIWLRSAGIADVGRINGADQAYYRIHASNMHRTIYSGRLFDLESRRDAILSAFDKEAGILPGADHLRESACRSLACEAIGLAGEAVDRGEANNSNVPYQNFARDLWPDILQSRQWQVLARRRTRRQPQVMRHLRLAMRRIRDKLAWRRWWRTGVY